MSLWASFTLGLLTPLTAACVLPLYPGFISFLASKAQDRSPLLIGAVVTAGVLLFMGAVGLVFTTFLETSLTSVIQIVSPVAFAILALISLLLLFDVDFSRFLPEIQAPQAKNPYLHAGLFGFFFGAIVIPCNPGFIAAFFTQAALADSALQSMGNFLGFGVGMAAPLLVIAGLSQAAAKQVVGWLARHKTVINRAAGAIMLAVSTYYLFFVFRVFG